MLWWGRIIGSSLNLCPLCPFLTCAFLPTLLSSLFRQLNRAGLATSSGRSERCFFVLATLLAEAPGVQLAPGVGDPSCLLRFCAEELLLLVLLGRLLSSDGWLAGGPLPLGKAAALVGGSRLGPAVPGLDLQALGWARTGR